jgi:adenine deaminase
MTILKGNLVDVWAEKIWWVALKIDSGKILQIEHLGEEKQGENYFLPGFVDAHVHIESSMLTPVQFARLAVVHGSVATVSDPHEIANVLGLEGVKYMIEDARRLPFKFCFGAPSCVPATTFETAGATLSAQDIETLFGYEEIGYLAEMMNFPGVLNDDPVVMEKIRLAHKHNKPVDGHAPGLRGEAARKYIAAGIETDHECFTRDEALEKLNLGMKILIREGSAAKNFEALIPLAEEHFMNMMFCSDDKHPDSLVEGHINTLVKRAVDSGLSLFKALRMACINPVLHYRLKVGLLREGDAADFIVVDKLPDFSVLNTYINGEKISEKGTSLLPNLTSAVVNNFNCAPLKPAEIELQAYREKTQVRVIQVLDNQLITNQIFAELVAKDGKIVGDLSQDILKIVVVNRYSKAVPAVAFIQNFGLRTGALASSVAHDSHNIIAVGTSDEAICKAINLVVQEQGGISAVDDNESHILALPIAGLMSSDDGYAVANAYSQIDNFTKSALGSTLSAPFMSLSFMALLVIPALKLSDKGLFDGSRFEFVSVTNT